MPVVELDQGRVEYRVAGPEGTTAPPVVFVHGLLVNAELWTRTADLLAARGVRSYAPNLPLGAHPIALHDGSDTSVGGVVTLLLDFLAALDLRDVTLVGNDTGGGLCQLLVDRDHTRVGRLVLTNCDAFDKFPPFPFGALKFGSTPRRAALMMRAARPRPVRHSVLGFGGLAATPLDPDMTARWAGAAVGDRGVARDVAGFLASLDKRILADAAGRLGRFDKPVRLVWGDADPFFKIALAERLERAFPNASLHRVTGGRAFVPYDFPEQLADQIGEFSSAPA